MPRFLAKFETLLFWIAFFLFAFIPLYPKFPLIHVHGTFAAIRLEDLLIAISLGLWGIYIILSKQIVSLLKDRLIQLVLLFFGVGLLATLSGAYLTHTLTLSLGILHYLRRIELMMLMPMMVTAIRTRKQFRMILGFMLVVTFIVCIYAIGQQFFHFPVVSTTNSEFAKGEILYLTPAGRVNSTFAGHYDLAVYLMMVLTILAAVIFSYKAIGFVASTITAGLSAFVLVLTAARFSFFGAVVGVIMSLIMTGKRKVILLILAIMVVALVYPSQLRDRFISTVTVNIEKGGTRYQGDSADQAQSTLNIPTLSLRVASNSAESTQSATPSGKVASDIASGEPVDTTELGVYRSFEIRLKVEWPRAIRALMQNPFLGSGYSSLGLATDNDILRSLGEVGILGTWAFALIFIEIFKRFWRLYKNGTKFTRAFAAGMIAMTIALVMNGLFIDVFEASKIAALFWMIVGLTLAEVKKLSDY